MAACTEEPRRLDPLPPAPPRMRPDGGPLDGSSDDAASPEAGVDPNACRPNSPTNPKLLANASQPLEACLAVAEAECVYHRRCIEGAPLPYLPEAGGAGVVFRVGGCRGQDPVANGCLELAEAIDAGRVEIDPAGLAACLEAASSPCRPVTFGSGSRYDGGPGVGYGGPGYLEPEFRCGWLRPAQVEGEPCAQDGDCVSGRCTEACPGRCEPMATVGSSCTLNVHCLGVGVCREGRCTERKAIGAACTPVFGEGQECVDGAFCDPHGTCLARIPAEAPCLRGQFDPCVPGYTCGPESRCVPLYGRDGEPCDVDRLCAPPNVCRGDRCQPAKVGGEDCGGRERLSCDFGCTCQGPIGDERCGPLRYRGEPCQVPEDCGDFLVCADGRCADPPQEGAACGPAWRCGHGRCEAGICRGRGAGQSCDGVGDGLDGVHGNCAAGLLCTGPGQTCAASASCDL